ncbi:MAG: DNA phosphorothioation system sulfurtransferase DndC [Betaproteobacteria bacterium]|nr:DNA phosphorothioation system sulfurtransferase DndC [Betaproteobacteria bacterium]
MNKLEQQSEVLDRLGSIRSEIRNEYAQQHRKPWVIGFSAGKDSSVLLHIVIDALLTVAPEDRTRDIYVLSNDTLVESPVYQSWVDDSLDNIRQGMAILGLPVKVIKTSPEENTSFWVNLIGRGYPAPSRGFRWCTDRMKIRPTTRFIKEKVSEAGEVILLLGVRKDESAVRAARIDAYSKKSEDGRLHPHPDLRGCLIFRPIMDLSTDDIWSFLAESQPPWGGDYRQLIAMYRNANGGECPFLIDPDDAPSCGTTSARFGCWTCTVVEKDNSLAGLIDAGFKNLAPLASFRDRLKDVSNKPEYRSKIRRDGSPGLGPLTMDARRMLLAELLSIQEETGLSLISTQEIRLIRDQWEQDASDAVIRDARRVTSFVLKEATS